MIDNAHTLFNRVLYETCGSSRVQLHDLRPNDVLSMLAVDFFIINWCAHTIGRTFVGR